MKSLTKKPGQFRAQCDQPKTWEPAPAELVAEWRAHLETPYPWGPGREAEQKAHAEQKRRLDEAMGAWPAQHPDTKEWGRWEPCGLDTEERALFELHMLEVHDLKLGQQRGVRDGIEWLRNKPLRGRGFKAAPLSKNEKSLLGRNVEITLSDGASIRAQIWAEVDHTLVSGYRAAFSAVDALQQNYVFGYNARTETCGPTNPLFERGSGAVRLLIEAEAVAS